MFSKHYLFLLIKLISVLLYLKYWYYNTPSLELPFNSRPLCQISPWPTKISLQHNPLRVLHRFSYFVLPNATKRNINWIYQTKFQPKSIKFIIKLYINQYLNGQTRYPSKIWAIKSRFSFKVRQHGQQQLYLQYKVCRVLYKMVGTLSFSQPCLCMQPPLQSRPKMRSPTSANFYLHIQSLLVHKIILTILTNTPFLYTSAIFHLPIFAYCHP